MQNCPKKVHLPNRQVKFLGQNPLAWLHNPEALDYIRHDSLCKLIFNHLEQLGTSQLKTKEDTFWAIFILDTMFNYNVDIQFIAQDLFLTLTSCLMRKSWSARAGLQKSPCVPWLTVLWLIWFTMCADTFLFHTCH